MGTALKYRRRALLLLPVVLGLFLVFVLYGPWHSIHKVRRTIVWNVAARVGFFSAGHLISNPHDCDQSWGVLPCRSRHREIFDMRGGDLVSLLRGTSDTCNDFAQLPLWRLAREPLLSPEALVQVERFLASDNLNNFTAAAECLTKVRPDTAAQLLRPALSHRSVFVRFRAATVLAAHKDYGAVDQLAAGIETHAFSPGELRDVLWRLFAVAPARLYPLYIRLLSDSSLWVRYHAIGQLRQFCGSTLGFDYRLRSGNETAIARLGSWFAEKAKSGELSRATREPDSLSGRGVLGVRLEVASTYPRVKKVFSWSPLSSAVDVVSAELLEVDGFSTEGKTAIELASYEFSLKPGDLRVLVFRGSAGTVTHRVRAVSVRVGEDDFLQDVSGMDI